MKDQIYAWMIISSVWFFAVGPLLLGGTYSGYKESVKLTFLVTGLTAILVTLAILFDTAMSQLFGV